MNEATKQLMIVGDVREALNKLANHLGCDPQLILPQDALIQWQNLEKQYEEFYKLPIQERLYKSGLATENKS